MKKTLLTFVLALIVFSCKKNDTKKETISEIKVEKADNSKIKISPISHATAVITFDNEVIYLDPTGGAKAFSKHKKPTYILITDIHGDHMNMKTLSTLDLKRTTNSLENQSLESFNSFIHT